MHKYRGYQEAEASSVYKGGFSPREEWNSGCTIGLGCEVEDVDVNVEPGESYKERKKERKKLAKCCRLVSGTHRLHH